MKTSALLLAAASACFFTISSAQTPVDHPVATGSSATDTLALNADQIQRIEAANLSYSQAMNALSSSNEPIEVRSKKSTELNAQHEAEIKAIMTPEQYQHMIQVRKANRAKAMQARQSAVPHNE